MTETVSAVATVRKPRRATSARIALRVDAVDRAVGKRVQDRRRALGLSQAQLAARIGVSAQQLSKMEHAANRVSCGRLARIAAALDTAPGWFFEQEDES